MHSHIWVLSLALGFLLSSCSSSPQSPGQATDSNGDLTLPEPQASGPWERRKLRAPETKATPELLSKIQTACELPLALDRTEGYRGPIVDAHVHVAVDNAQGPFALALLDEMNRTGVSRVLIQLDHSPDLTTNSGLLDRYRAVETLWGEFSGVCPRLMTLIYAFDPADDTSWAYVHERLETGNYAGVGEIEFLHSRQNIRKPVRSKSLDHIYEALSAREGIFHLQATTQDDPALAKEIEALIRSYPKIRFVWFAGQDCFKLTGLRNLTCTVFPNDHMYGFDRFPIQGKSRAVIGTDHAPAGFHSASAGHLPYDSFGEGVLEARKLLMQIDPHWRDGVAHKNFDGLYSNKAKQAK